MTSSYNIIHRNRKNWNSEKEIWQKYDEFEVIEAVAPANLYYTYLIPIILSIMVAGSVYIGNRSNVPLSEGVILGISATLGLITFVILFTFEADLKKSSHGTFKTKISAQRYIEGLESEQ